MMRTIYRLDGLMVDINQPRTIGDIQYPHLRDVWQELGIVQVEVDDFPDLGMFDVAEDLAGNLTIKPKSQEVLNALSNTRIQQQITALETASGVVRIVREYMLADFLRQAQADGYTEAQLISVNIGYAKLKAQDDQIRALRAQLV